MKMPMISRSTVHVVAILVVSHLYTLGLIFTGLSILHPSTPGAPVTPLAPISSCAPYIPPKALPYPSAPVMSSSTLSDDSAFKAAIVGYVKTLQKAYDAQSAQYESSYLKYRSTCPH